MVVLNAANMRTNNRQENHRYATGGAGVTQVNEDSTAASCGV